MYELDTSLIDQLPDWFQQIPDFVELINAEQPSFDAVADEIIAVADNFFFQTMDESAVSQWEQIFNISPNPSIETLEFRRTRVMNRISSNPPYTLGFLYQKLDELIGTNQWTVTVDYPNYTLYIESSALNQSYATEVAFTINRIKPAHIVYINKPYVQTGLLLSETISLSQLEYNYRLGGWGLGLLPFATENSMGVIKTATTPSIQQQLLEDVANFTSNDIVSAQVNGSIAISSINKSVSGSTCTVTYSVSPSQTTEITSVSLLDSEGNPLTTSNIYVPVKQGNILTHRIPVAEGVNSNGQ